MINVFLILLLVVAVVLLWIMLYDTNRFVTVCHTFEDKRIRRSCRAAVLADLHNKRFGADNGLLIQAIRDCRPDMILVAGDLLTAVPGQSLDVAVALLKELKKDYPIYYANGNHEHRLKLYPETYGDMAEKYEDALKELGIDRLVNEHIELEEYGIEIYGSEIHREYYNRFGVRPMEEEYLTKLLGAPSREKYTILLAHKPDYFPQYAAWGADLTLSGHVHGGVVRMPFWGKGVVSPSIRLFPRYDGGIFEEERDGQDGQAVMLVSRGLGYHTIPFRLFNPGELLVIDFKSGQTEDEQK